MTHGSTPYSTPAVLRAVQTLNIDRTTALVARHLNAAGVRTVLLKGPSVARWLYDDPAERSYVDSDLLVESSKLRQAINLLEDLGLRTPLADAGRWEQDLHSIVLSCTLGDPLLAEVDLHFTLPRANAPPDRVWQALAAESVPFRVGGYDLEALSEVACAVVVALHAAHNGRENAQSTQDLERLVDRLSPMHWPRVRLLADQIGALPALAYGLQLAPGGAGLARELGLRGETSVEMELISNHAPPLAYGVSRLASSPSWGDRLRMVASELWPTHAFLTVWAEREGHPARSPVGRRLARLVYLVRGAAPAVQAFLRARHSSLRLRHDD